MGERRRTHTYAADVCGALSVRVCVCEYVRAHVWVKQFMLVVQNVKHVNQKSFASRAAHELAPHFRASGLTSIGMHIHSRGSSPCGSCSSDCCCDSSCGSGNAAMATAALPQGSA